MFITNVHYKCTTKMYIYNAEIYCTFFMYKFVCSSITVNTFLPLQKQVEKHVLRNTQELLDINELLECIKHICERTSPSACNSAKYHLPYHWLDTRLQLGCSAAEKSLERKLGEAQKKYFPFTNGKQDGTQVQHYICAFHMYHSNVL